MPTAFHRLAVIFLIAAACAQTAVAAKPFQITVVDVETKRGVPLVELKTTGGVRYVTDSNGIVAFAEPGLMDQRVFFSISSHGYEYRKDGFGFRGAALDVKPGGLAQLLIRRINIVQRLTSFFYSSNCCVPAHIFVTAKKLPWRCTNIMAQGKRCGVSRTCRPGSEGQRIIKAPSGRHHPVERASPLPTVWLRPTATSFNGKSKATSAR